MFNRKQNRANCPRLHTAAVAAQDLARNDSALLSTLSSDIRTISGSCFTSSFVFLNTDSHLEYHLIILNAVQ
jgi:hypothetical protein